MEYRDFTKAAPITEDTPEGLSYFRAEFESGVLRIHYPVKDANGVEEYVLGMVQPYKFNDTGAQIPFIDAEDAFTWLEAVKQRVV